MNSNNCNIIIESDSTVAWMESVSLNKEEMTTSKTTRWSTPQVNLELKLKPGILWIFKKSYELWRSVWLQAMRSSESP